MIHDPRPVVVIGGGPAGAAAAIRLARGGWPVVLVERAAMPRAKVCGGCLNRRSIAALTRIGQWPPPDGMVRPLHRAEVRVAGRRGAAPRTVRCAIGDSAAVERSTFDTWLLSRAVDAGVDVRAPATAEVRPPTDDGSADRATGEPVVQIVSPGGGAPEPVRASLVLVADGLGGGAMRRWPEAFRTRRALGWPRRNVFGFGTVLAAGDAGTICEDVLMIIARGGYVGVARLPGGRLDVAAAASPEWVRAAGGPRPALATLLQVGGAKALAARIESGEAERIGGTPRLMSAARCAAWPGGMRIGDALAYAEPFTGEGMAWALGSGVEAADEILAGAAADDRGTDAWRGRLAGRWTSIAARRRRRMAGCVALGLGIAGERRARAAVAVAAALPPVRGGLVAMMGRRPVRRLAGAEPAGRGA